MRAPLALLLFAAGSTQAATPPPPPYAADPQFSAAAQGAPQPDRRGRQVADRYTGGAPHPIAAAPAQQYAFSSSFPAPAPAAPAPTRTLGWSGKVEASQQASAMPAQGNWSQAPSKWGSTPATAQQTAYPAYRTASAQGPAADQGWRPLYSQAAPAAPQPQVPVQPQAGSPPQAQPRSIYDAPTLPQAPASPQQDAQAQTPNGPRFYSLHREYGIEPNPIPIPPQFFGPTADLSAPPPDPTLRRMTDSNGQTHVQAAPSTEVGG